MEQKKNTPESIAISLLFYSFIVAMSIFAICRACNIGIFANGYISIETSEVIYYAISMAFHLYEGFLILKILTKLRWYNCLIIAACYTVLANIIGNHTIIFLLDLMYIISVPFIFNEDKEKSIKNSIYFILGMTAYQFIMSFGRYDVTTLGKYDIGYAVLSFIDYRLFLLTVLLNKIRRTKNMGDSPNCFLFWGRFSEFCKLVGLVILAVIATPLIMITPFYLLAKYTYKAIPEQHKVFKEECRKKREEKNSESNN